MTRKLAATAVAALAAAFVLGGCAGGTPSTGGEPTTSVPTATATVTPTAAVDQAVTVGRSFSVGGHQMRSGWKITDAKDFGRWEYFSNTQIVGTVSNTGDAPAEASWHFEFTRDGVPIGRADLHSSMLWPGKAEQVTTTLFAENVKELVYDHITVKTN